MTKENDLSHQADTHHQLLSRSFTLILPIWTIIFTLLLTGNLLLCSWICREFYSVYWDKSGYHSASPAGLVGLEPVLFALVIVDFVMVLFYIRKQHPQGIAKFISYTAFIFISLALIYLYIIPVVLLIVDW